MLLMAARKVFVEVTALARPSACRGPEKVTLVNGMDCGDGGGSTLGPTPVTSPQANEAGLSGLKAAAALAELSARATACTGGFRRAAGAVTPGTRQ